MIASPMRRLIDELSFRVRVVLTILIVATASVIVAWDEPVITALVDMARALADVRFGSRSDDAPGIERLCFRMPPGLDGPGEEQPRPVFDPD